MKNYVIILLHWLWKVYILHWWWTVKIQTLYNVFLFYNRHTLHCKYIISVTAPS